LIRNFFEQERAAGRPLVAAIVISTEGSTYRKPGAFMLFAATGERCGLLSGGCLEGDLQDHALALLASDNQRTVVRHYDSRGSDDAIWGLGLGCEGAMQVLLLRLDSSNRYQPLSGLFEADDAQRLSAFDIDIQSGAVTKSVSFTTELVGTTFRIVSSKTVRLLVCGAGPDVEPVEKLATLIGWRVTIVDHRPAYIQSQRFDDRTRLVLSDRFDLAPIIGTETFDAAVVMSHHLIADEHYLKALAAIDIPYIGLLGPLTRRQRLFASLGPISKKLIPRLRAPVGLDLGGRTPEEIALSIVAEIQAALNGRHGAPFSSGR
jgi:xanthine/CO dehydrogenase XdhC/CoxF family maturation factor